MGISKAHDERELEEAFRLAAEFDRKVIIERGIEGRELECSVLGNEAPIASLPCEILPSREFYDYEDKYVLDKARVQVPAELGPEHTGELRRLAVECYRAVECGVLAERSLCDRDIDARDVHQRNSSGAEIQVTDFAITHLALGKSHGAAGCIEQGVREGIPETMPDRGPAQLDRVTLARRAIAPAIEDYQNHRPPVPTATL